MNCSSLIRVSFHHDFLRGVRTADPVDRPAARRRRRFGTFYNIWPGPVSSERISRSDVAPR
jgi:hypothetical protein